MDTISLLERSQNGDSEARDELVLKNAGLVWSIVKRFMGRGCEAEDLFQIGNIGLIKAIDKFDLSLGLQFSTYAVPLIQGEIKRFLRDDGLIKVSRILKDNARNLYRNKDLIEKEKGREATLEEMAEAAGLDIYDAAMAVAACSEVESLYKTIYDNDGSDIYLIDKTGQNEEFSEEILTHMALGEVVSSLGERDRFIIGKRYYENKTQSEVAKMLDISQVQVSRLEKKILASMRERLTV
ncbi:MAG: SigB/SigF/SigG family RNA polymerase sigma factor [Lachnospiraceae bacterium]|nr:SigB/SigF/SigG family RNA polymerase sigma factor [Lachnospiraceae bacterium]